MDDIIERLRNELHASSDEQTRVSGPRFFREDVHLHGVKTGLVTTLARKYLKELRHLAKTEVFSLCERLWASGYLEESFVACSWAYEFRGSYEPADFATFERWVSDYVTNWAACDTLCNHTVGSFVERYPEYLEALKRWARSENRWMRRAAAVSLIIPARNGMFLDQVFAIADVLRLDRDDLVQKGYGWMLKAASEAHQQEVFAYVLRHRATMPRTALRYAIEKMPPELKHKAMER
jgi:3-methyladenine DNA glycosylase AlkD